MRESLNEIFDKKLKSILFYIVKFIFGIALLSISTTSIQAQDSDGDGVNNVVDLDDDNDGILDVDEGGCFTPTSTAFIDGVEDTSFFPESYWAVTYYEGHDGIVGSPFIPQTGTGGTGAGAGTIFRGESFFGLNEPTSSFAANGSNPGNGAWLSTETPTVPILPLNYVGTVWPSSGSAPFYEMDFRRQAPFAGSLTIGGTPNTYFDDTVEIFINGTRVHASYPSGGPDPYPSPTVSFTFPLNAGDEVYIRFINLGGIGGLSFIASFPFPIDTDRDGIPNCLDLDSDGDGCPDAVEAGLNFQQSDLTDATATDLNVSNNNNSDGSVIGYIGTSNISVISNLGTVSEMINPATLGVPQVSGITITPQAVGISQNVSTTNCTDSDNDNVPDIVDLDDDNDGILDTEEGCTLNTGVFSTTTTTSGTVTLPITGGTANWNIVNSGGFTSIVDSGISDNNELFFVYTGPGSGGGGYNLTSNFALNSIPASAELQLVLHGFVDATSGAFSPTFGSRFLSYTISWVGGIGNAQLFDPLGTQIVGGSQSIANGGTYVQTDGDSPTSRAWLNNSLQWFVLFPPGATEFTITASSGAAAEGFRFSVVETSCIDTDGDGIINSLDLDSDGDGCPDAIEGDLSFVQADLTEATGTGLNLPNNNNNDGSIASGYLGSTTNSVISNLGLVSDTDPTSLTFGVPLSPPSSTPNTQGVGGSQNVSDTNSCCTVEAPGLIPN